MWGIGHWLLKRGELTPYQEAVVDRERRVTYLELNQRVNRLCAALVSRGLEAGDRVALLSYNSLEFVEIIMACAKLGLILVPLNWRLTASELAFIVNDSGAQALVFDPDLLELAGDLLAQVVFRQLICLGPDARLGALPYDQLLHSSGDNEPETAVAVGPKTPHIIMYTAGTTGKAKGAVLSQGASLWNALNLHENLNFTSQDRDLAVLPMFHIGGIGLFTLPMLYVGGTVVIQRTFDPLECLRLLRGEKITLFFGVPAIFLFMIQHPEFKPEAFKNVRVVMCGGAPLPTSLVEQYDQAGVIVQQGFGMSEAAPSIATLSKEKALAKAGSIGQPLFHLDTRIVDEHGLDVPANEVGELLIKGPNVMLEYWNRPEATADSFANGWFQTGDLAKRDGDGDLYIVDRKKDMFISGGENVYPAEVEDAIYRLEDVSEAALIGVPDAKWGEAGKAFVALKEGRALTAGDVLEHLRTCLAKYKIPKEVVFVEALPRNAAGKVLKKELRQGSA